MAIRSDGSPDLSALSGLASELAATLTAISSDIALVVDDGGIIQAVRAGSQSLADSTIQWVGKPWVETVTGDTRRKVELLLDEVRLTGVSRRREVNHQTGTGDALPVAYAAVRLGASGPVMVAGRDLRAIAAIQQRFVQSQQDMERDYWARRQAESRYRLLFQVATDAVLVVDAQSLAVVDANAAAGAMFGLEPDLLVGRNITVVVDAQSRHPVEEMLAAARATGRAGEIRVKLAGCDGVMLVSATPFRGENHLHLLVRISALEAHQVSTANDFKLSGFVERSSDAVAITDASGRLKMANPAFLRLCRIVDESRLSGHSVAEWLGSSTGDALHFLDQVRGRGVGPRTTLAFRSGAPGISQVDVSAALLTDGDQEHIGFVLRAVDEGGLSVNHTAIAVAESIAHLVSLLGDASLPQLRAEVVRLAEDHVVRAASRRSLGDPQLAARLLGIERAEFESLQARLALTETPPADDSQRTTLH